MQMLKDYFIIAGVSLLFFTFVGGVIAAPLIFMLNKIGNYLRSKDIDEGLARAIYVMSGLVIICLLLPLAIILLIQLGFISMG